MVCHRKQREGCKYDAARLRGYNLTLTTLAQQLGADNMAVPGGELNSGSQTLSVRTDGEYQSIDDVKNALISLSNVVCEALEMGMSVDLAELGNLRVSVPSKMMDTAAEVTAKDALKTPKIVFTPKQKMRDAANKVELSIDKGTVTTSSSGGTSGGSGEGSDGSFG